MKYLLGVYPTMFLRDAEGNKLSEDLGELKGGGTSYIAKLRTLLARIESPEE